MPELPAQRDGPVDRAVGDLAGAQFGLVTRAQLRRLGLGPGAIAHRVRCGRLRIVHRGVYQVGHTAAPEFAPELAAVLAVGEGAVLSHRSAARVWGLIPARAAPDETEVTVVGRKPSRRSGVLIHRTKELDRRDRRRRGPLPLTAPARTIVDLATSSTFAALEQAIAQAVRRRLARQDEIAAAAKRAGRRRGTAGLRTLLEVESVAYTRSGAERRMLALIRRAGLQAPQVNARLAGFEVDFLWRARRLVVEVDGFGFHGDRAAFETDRRRDAELVARGYRVMRFTWRRLCDEPVAIVARLASVLASSDNSARSGLDGRTQ